MTAELVGWNKIVGMNSAAKSSCQHSFNINPVTGVKTPWFLHLQEDGRLRSRYFRCNVPEMVLQEMCCPTLEVLDTVYSDVAFVDWLTIVFEWFDTEYARSELDSLLRKQLGFGLLRPVLDRNEREVGLLGYEKSYLLEDGTTRFAIGGKSQRDTAVLSFCGESMDFLNTPDRRINLRHLGEVALQGWLTRIDLAADFFTGKYTVDDCARDYDAGKFKCHHGRPPTPGFIDKGRGRTFMVGNRARGKQARVYEKGRQLGSQIQDSYYNWTRVEVEYHGSRPRQSFRSRKQRVIPWDALTYPGRYLAGSYPAFAFISEKQDHIKTLAVKVALDLRKQALFSRRVCGRFVSQLKMWGYSDSEILSILERGEGFPPERLPSRYKDVGLSDEKIQSIFWELHRAARDFEFAKSGIPMDDRGAFDDVPF